LRSLEILEFSLYQLIFEDHVQADKARYIKLKKKMRKSNKRSKAIDCKSHIRYNIAEESFKKKPACKNDNDNVSYPMVKGLYKAKCIEMLLLEIRNKLIKISFDTFN